MNPYALSPHPPPHNPHLQALFCLIIYFMGGLRLTAGAFFANIFTMMLVTLTAQVRPRG